MSRGPDVGYARRELLRLGAGAVAAATLAACATVRRGGPDDPSPADAELAADLGETLWVGIPGTTLHPATRAALARGAFGGVALFARNVGSDGGAGALAALAALCDALHEVSRAGSGVLVAVDQEGGRVQAIRGAATRWPAMARLAASGVDATAVGRALGDELAALGIDMDFAPVLDLARSDGASGVIGDRALAADPASVTRLGGALARGLAAAGVLACGKHFPGHGGSTTDSHLDLPVDESPQAELLAGAVAPFASLAAELPLLMAAHVAYAGLGSELPGSLDPRVATELLRDRLGFTGVLVSDNLEMGAVSRRFTIEDAAVRALAAGCDALLLCHQHDSLPRARLAVWNAARDSSVLRQRVAEAAGRVRSLKARHLARGMTRPPLSVVGAPAHLDSARQMAF